MSGASRFASRGWLAFGALVLVVSSASPALAQAQTPSPVSPEEARQLFTWYDELGIGTLNDCPFIRVWVASSGMNGETQHWSRFGFLLDETPGRFAVIHDVVSHVYDRRPRVPGNAEVWYETLDLRQEVETLLGLNESAVNEDWPQFPFASREPTPRLELVLIASAAWRLGLSDDACQILGIARMARRGRYPQDDVGDLLTRVKDDVAYVLLWEAVTGCGDPTISRPQLRERFEFIASRLSETTYASTALEHAQVLRDMIRADEVLALNEHQSRDREAEIAELVQLLRDQNGRQVLADGRCNIYNDLRGTESPAARLRRLGDDAVPALLGILDDRRLTRCIEFDRSCYFRPRVLRFGDVALRIVGSIAQRRLNSPAEAREWWETVRHNE